MTTASDDFNRANETPLASPWTNWLSTGANLVSNAATGVSAASRASFYNSGTWSDDQECSGIVGNLGSGVRYSSVGVRCAATSGGRGYMCYTDGVAGASHTDIVRLTNGTETIIKSVATAFANGDRIGIRAVGTSISMWKNGTQIDSVNDSTYTSGYPGINFYGLATMDDWQAADVGTGTGGSGWRAAFAVHANQSIG